MENEVKSREEQAKQLLSQLKTYAREHNLSNRELAKEFGVPYNTLSKWWFFSRGEAARKPSEPHLNIIKEFLEAKSKPEVYAQIKEARHRIEKVKYLLLLLEDELRWFRDNEPRARDEFRKELDASDIGYISSLLTMLTEEDKFNRWLALTTTRFQSFKRG
jgi:transcriptional regulator with XRE-family HTH domain